MVSTIPDLASDTENVFDLHALRSQWNGLCRVPFREVDTFEGVVSDPVTLHKYLYGNVSPVNNTDPSGMFSEGLKGLLITTGINAALFGLTFGSIRFAFAKARGVETSVAFREGLVAGGWGALLAVPVVGHVLGAIGLYQTGKELVNGDLNEMDRLELATNLAAALILGRAGPALGRSFTPSYSFPEPPPGTQLPRTSRLAIIFQRLRGKPQASNSKEAHQTLSRVMREVEDAYSGIAENPNPGRVPDGRMYPPQADYTYKAGIGWVAKSVGHWTVFYERGGITIINRKTRAVEFHDGPAGPLPFVGDDTSD